MNLNHNPTREQLADLLRGYNDRANHHVLWVDDRGDVRITALPKRWPPPEPGPDVLERARVRFETFQAGNGYVGAEAAANDEWINDAFEWLMREWNAARSGAGTALISI